MGCDYGELGRFASSRRTTPADSRLADGLRRRLYRRFFEEVVRSKGIMSETVAFRFPLYVT